MCHTLRSYGQASQCQEGWHPSKALTHDLETASSGGHSGSGMIINGARTPRVLEDVGYARVSSSTGMVRTPAVWRAYSAKPG